MRPFSCFLFLFLQLRDGIKADQRVELHAIWQPRGVGDWKGVSVALWLGRKERIPSAGWLAGWLAFRSCFPVINLRLGSNAVRSFKMDVHVR